MNVTLTDTSPGIKRAMTAAVRAALEAVGARVAAEANRNVHLDGEAGAALRGSYRYETTGAGDAVSVGTAREEGYWEEYGTGSHADTEKNGGKPGRQDWWVYTEGEGHEGAQSRRYASQEEAEAAARQIGERYGKNAAASNGREPSYTLEKAFVQAKEQAIRMIGTELELHTR